MSDILASLQDVFQGAQFEILIFVTAFLALVFPLMVCFLSKNTVLGRLILVNYVSGLYSL